jgi:YVTN family beta-propeller protein
MGLTTRQSVSTHNERCFGASIAVLAVALAVMPATAAPFAYITNETSNVVSVIDTGATPPAVVHTLPVEPFPFGVGVTPDGKHVYVTNRQSNTVSVIDTTTAPHPVRDCGMRKSKRSFLCPLIGIRPEQRLADRLSYRPSLHHD